jgi:adenylate cyclase
VHHGRVVKRTGDGAIVEFRSVVDAVNCAIESKGDGRAQRGVAPDKRITSDRHHLGDVLEEATATHGRRRHHRRALEGIAAPGVICLSEDAYRQVKGG